jgi:small subunit ribosomal protein S21
MQKKVDKSNKTNYNKPNMRKFNNNKQINGRTVDLRAKPRHPKDRRPPQDMPFDIALRKFRKQIEKAGIIKELRAREFYEKPTAKRKRKAAEGRKRWLKQVAKDNLQNNLPRAYRGRR